MKLLKKTPRSFHSILTNDRGGVDFSIVNIDSMRLAERQQREQTLDPLFASLCPVKSQTGRYLKRLQNSDLFLECFLKGLNIRGISNDKSSLIQRLKESLLTFWLSTLSIFCYFNEATTPGLFVCVGILCTCNKASAGVYIHQIYYNNKIISQLTFHISQLMEGKTPLLSFCT